MAPPEPLPFSGTAYLIQSSLVKNVWTYAGLLRLRQWGEREKSNIQHDDRRPGVIAVATMFMTRVRL